MVFPGKTSHFLDRSTQEPQRGREPPGCSAGPPQGGHGQAATGRRDARAAGESGGDVTKGTILAILLGKVGGK